jgi:hypothetical protein
MKLINYNDLESVLNNYTNIDDLRSAISKIPVIKNLKLSRKSKNISKDGFFCSYCKFGDFGLFRDYRPRFCPNCGSKIKKKKKYLGYNIQQVVVDYFDNKKENENETYGENEEYHS